MRQLLDQSCRPKNKKKNNNKISAYASFLGNDSVTWPTFMCTIDMAHDYSFLPDKFHPTQAFSFPKRRFGSKGEERSFRVEWCNAFSWLHYDVHVGQDAAFCYLCMRCGAEKKSIASTKRDPAFISKGFTYWKEGPKAFKKHQGCDCHREAVKALVVLPQCTQDVGELQSAEHQAEKARNDAVSASEYQISCKARLTPERRWR